MRTFWVWNYSCIYRDLSGGSRQCDRARLGFLVDDVDLQHPIGLEVYYVSLNFLLARVGYLLAQAIMHRFDDSKRCYIPYSNASRPICPAKEVLIRGRFGSGYAALQLSPCFSWLRR